MAKNQKPKVEETVDTQKVEPKEENVNSRNTDYNKQSDDVLQAAERKADDIIADAQKKASDIVRTAKEQAKIVADQVVKDAENRAIEAVAAINSNGGKLDVAGDGAPKQVWMYNGGPETGVLVTEGEPVPEGYTDSPS